MSDFEQIFILKRQLLGWLIIEPATTALKITCFICLLLVFRLLFIRVESKMYLEPLSKQLRDLSSELDNTIFLSNRSIPQKKKKTFHLAIAIVDIAN